MAFVNSSISLANIIILSDRGEASCSNRYFTLLFEQRFFCNHINCSSSAMASDLVDPDLSFYLKET